MGCAPSKSIPGRHSPAQIIPEYEPHIDGKKYEGSKITSRVIDDIKVTSKYEIKCHIGSGAFSDVFWVEKIDSKLPFAIKVLDFRSLKSRQMFQSESDIMTQIKHKNIVKLEEVIRSDNCAFIVMELATGGDLFDKMQTNKTGLKENEVIRITGMLLDAAVYLHEKGITHRDLKPENVLFYKPGANSRVIVTDFGLARHFTVDSVLSTYCGTIQYLSPEITENKPYTNKCDIWAIGVMVYVMLCGQLPFKATEHQLLGKQIASLPHSFNRQIWKKVSPHAKDFINKTLNKSPEERLTALAASQHLWFKNTSIRLKHSTPSIISSRTSGGRRTEISAPRHQKYTDVSSCTNSRDNETFCGDSSTITESSKPVLPLRTSTRSPSEQPCDHHKNIKNSNLIKMTSCNKNMFNSGDFVLPESDKRISLADLESTDTSTTTSTCECVSQQVTDGREVPISKENVNIIQVQQRTSNKCVNEGGTDRSVNINNINNIILKSTPNTPRPISLAHNMRYSRELHEFRVLHNNNNNGTYVTNRSRHRSSEENIQHIIYDRHICHDPRTLNWISTIKR